MSTLTYAEKRAIQTEAKSGRAEKAMVWAGRALSALPILFLLMDAVIKLITPMPAFVAEAWRVTKPGGLFAVYEHNPINPLTKVAVWRCPFDHDAVLLRAGRVIDLLEAQGFEIVAKEYLFFVPADAKWARRTDRALAWLPLGAQYVVCARKPG